MTVQDHKSVADAVLVASGGCVVERSLEHLAACHIAEWALSEGRGSWLPGLASVERSRLAR